MSKKFSLTINIPKDDDITNGDDSVYDTDNSYSNDNGCNCNGDCYRCRMCDVWPDWPTQREVNGTKNRMRRNIERYLEKIHYSEDAMHRVYYSKEMFRYLEEYSVIYFLNDLQLNEEIKRKLAKFYDEGHVWASSFSKALFNEPLHSWKTSDKVKKERIKNKLLERFDVPKILDFHKLLADSVLNETDGDIENAVQIIYDLFYKNQFTSFVILDK